MRRVVLAVGCVSLVAFLFIYGWVSKDDHPASPQIAAPQKPAMPVPSLDQSESRKLCDAAIRSSASHPSSVDIHSFVGFATKVYPDGSRVILQDFGAKNTYGLELIFQARCTTTAAGKFDIQISEK